MQLINDKYILKYSVDASRFEVFRCINDKYSTNYVIADMTSGLGQIDLVYQILNDDKSKNVLNTYSTNDSKIYECNTCNDKFQLRYLINNILELQQTYRFDKNDANKLEWVISLKNNNDTPIRLLDLALPLVMNTNYVKDTYTTYTKRVIRHSFISGQGSFLYWCRPNGIGPYLMMMPKGGTGLEFYEKERSNCLNFEGIYKVYIHSEYRGNQIPGSWRQEHTGLTVKPNETVDYSFVFEWVDSHTDVREKIYNNNIPDIYVIPGMTIPRGMDARLAIRTKTKDYHFLSEYPNETTISFLGKTNNYDMYDISFEHNGENMITLLWGEENKTYLEFFSTHPIEKLLNMRARHIVEKQQYKGDRWYDGMMSIWDMCKRQLGTPDNDLNMPMYCVAGSDDLQLGRASFLAYKNVHYPIITEIKAIEYYIEHFLWGKLQRTDKEEPYPCGIYGSESWYDNRNSEIGYNSGGHGKEHLWRTFDYTHIIQLYYMMYRIAKLYPNKVKYLDSQGYLDRAYLTSKAYFEVPYGIYMDNGWDFKGYTDWAFKQGNFHECFIVELIKELEKEGYKSRASELKRYWESKVKYMVYDHPYPFASEMYFDSTAFESTHAIAKYGIEHNIKIEESTFLDKNMYGPGEEGIRVYKRMKRKDFNEFMDKQIIANMACRMSIQPQYYALGSDIRQVGNTNFILTYMTQMGGWAIQDYGLNYASDYHGYIRLGYASYLAPLALINTGNDYPWWPHKENEGACGWVYSAGKNESRFICKEQYNAPRGPWCIDGEMDNGFTGMLQMACTTITVDDIFGRIALCGNLIFEEEGYSVIPLDGVGQCIIIKLENILIKFTINRDKITKLTVNRSQHKYIIYIKNMTNDIHNTILEIDGLQFYDIRCQNKYKVINNNINIESGKENIIVEMDVLDSNIF